MNWSRVLRRLRCVISLAPLLQGAWGEEDERPAVRALRLQGRGRARVLPRPDRVLRRHLGDHDLLPDLREPEEAASGEALRVARQRGRQGRVRLPGAHDGRGLR